MGSVRAEQLAKDGIRDIPVVVVTGTYDAHTCEELQRHWVHPQPLNVDEVFRASGGVMVDG